MFVYNNKFCRLTKGKDEEYINETNRQRRERKKLKEKTMAAVTGKLSGNNKKEESTPNGLRSGKYKKKKGKH